MGGCQSVGGAATSGRGLTGRQVAEALAATADAQRKRHRERLQTGEARAARADPCGVAELGSDQYNERRALQFETLGRGGVKELVTVHEYAPDVFRFLRQLHGLDEGVFADEWALPEERLHLELGEGRSMALFLKSKSMHFLCKTIGEEEVNVLLCILQQYLEYIAHNGNSLLTRFLMLLRVAVGEEVGFVLCFSDVFTHSQKLNERWDLKGRKPKPGKYVYFPKLTRKCPYEPAPYVIQSPCERMKPLVWFELSSGGAVMATSDRDKLWTRKDKDLTRLFWLERSVRLKLLQALMRDYEFLTNAGLMDYSLLIGVAYNEEDTTQSRKRIQSMRLSYPIGNENDVSLIELRPSSQLRGPSDDHEFFAGISSLLEQEVYFIGIIDILTRYTFKKKVANFCKSFLWRSETLSTIPPVEYHRDRKSVV